MNEIMEGLGALGFWLFMAVLVVAIAWAVVRKAKIRQETLTRIIESGQNLDAELIDKIFSPTNKQEQKPYDPYKHDKDCAGVFSFIGYIIVFFGIVKNPISYPIVGMGVFAMLWSFWDLYRVGKKEQAEKKNLEKTE